MAGGVSPLVRGRKLAAVLRRLRAGSGRTIEEVAQHLECSAAKISRIENGLVGVRIQDARDLLDLYGVQGGDRDEILDLVRQARKRGWWHVYADLISEDFSRVLGFEDEAASIWMAESRLIPGLLQTEAYSAALMSTRDYLPLDDIERGTRLRMTRRQILTRPEAAELHLLLDEAALLRRIGGPEVMAEQYNRLLDYARRPNIRLQVLPLADANHRGPGASYTILGFTDPADPKVVLEDTLERSYVHEEFSYGTHYMAAFDQAVTCAWSPDRSLEYLGSLAAEQA